MKDKTLQTQLASWAELRHDHILYVKQGMTGSIGCEFPDAYVEPVPQLYAAIGRMANKLNSIARSLESQGLSVDKATIEALEHFREVMVRLEEIAQKQLNHQALSQDEQRFLKQAVELEGKGYGPERWDGWYPRLLGKGPTADYDPTIADIHTVPQNASNGYIQQILYVGTGAFELATVAVDCPGERQCLYVGPVSTFYELIPDKGRRLDDSLWSLLLGTPQIERARPQWIQSFRPPDPTTTPTALQAGERSEDETYEEIFRIAEEERQDKATHEQDFDQEP